jgi:3',5'-cyclic AMP phosphodiesterase CpdA
MAVLGASASARSENSQPIISFGLIADCQYVDRHRGGSRYYRQSPGKLTEAVETLNKQPLSLSFHLGDYIDAKFESFDTLEPIASKLKSNLYHTLGNHDFVVANEYKKDVPKRLGLGENTYHSIRKNGVRFLVIDTTDVSTYRHPAGAKERVAANEDMAKWAAAGVPSASRWNGRPGDKQLAWIENEFIEATQKDEVVFLIGHHPVLPNKAHSVWDSEGLAQLFQKYPCAKAYLNGHDHAGAYVDAGGFHFLTLDGMVETESTNAYAYAELYPDRLEVVGFGRQESHTLKLR